ncbi:MAG: alkyl hydroperoxide reductase/Thiol specific antioxidant/Mal allergen [Clostridia bacterium]|jgi:peroxiredoxin|nr:alkyl hydroperoxide reductase/Thiol specific antioxidant/Mal allergen [Clostridia bacterium]
MKRSIIIWAVALILVAVAIFTTYQYNNNPAPAPTPAPAQSETPSDTADAGNDDNEIQESIDALDFKLKDLNGKEVSLSDYKGKTIYLNFWATWCPPCQEEMPYIQQLNKENQDPDFVILTIDIQEPEGTVKKFMEDNQYDFTVLMDKDGDVASMYGIQNIPLSLLIDKNFKIVSAYEGAMENFKMLKEFAYQLKEDK